MLPMQRKQIRSLLSKLRFHVLHELPLPPLPPRKKKKEKSTDISFPSVSNRPGVLACFEVPCFLVIYSVTILPEFKISVHVWYSLWGHSRVSGLGSERCFFQNVNPLEKTGPVRIYLSLQIRPSKKKNPGDHPLTCAHFRTISSVYTVLDSRSNVHSNVFSLVTCAYTFTYVWLFATPRTVDL